MPEFIDWEGARDQAAVLDRVRAILDAGGWAALPTETGVVLAVRADHPQAPPGFLREDISWSLALPEREEVAAWTGTLDSRTQRLLKRAWPGPVVFEFTAAAESGPMAQLPDAVRERIAPGGILALRRPGHDVILNLLDGLEVPLVLGEPARASAEWLAEHGEAIDLVLESPPRFDQPATRVRIEERHWTVTAPGVYSEDELRRLTACLVLFVCTGNTCRSPMAEALFKVMLAERLGCTVAELPDRGFWVMSAGVSAYSGDSSAAEAQAAVAEFGADLSAHQSRPVRPELVAVADYIVAMTASHLTALRELFPDLGTEPRLLCGDTDLPDPIGGDQAVYHECAQLIRAHLGSLIAEVTES